MSIIQAHCVTTRDYSRNSDSQEDVGTAFNCLSFDNGEGIAPRSGPGSAEQLCADFLVNSARAP